MEDLDPTTTVPVLLFPLFSKEVIYNLAASDTILETISLSRCTKRPPLRVNVGDMPQEQKPPAEI